MSAALETTLEWPRFCYTGPSLFEDSATTKKSRKRTKLPQNSQNKRLSSSSNTTESDGESGSLKDEQMVPNIAPNSFAPNRAPKSPQIRSEFAFSDLMRKMASKYQQPSDAVTEKPEKPSILSEAFTSMLSQYLPNPYTPSFLAPTPFMPFPHLTPALETLASSRALSALAQAQKRLREHQEELPESSPPPSKRAKNNSEDPLDLSSNASVSQDDEVDVLSIDPPSPSNIDSWGVDQVVDFVSNVESCREYAQIFHEHSIDGSALLVLNESHLTRIMGLKLGPAIRLRGAIQELKSITNYVE